MDSVVRVDDLFRIDLSTSKTSDGTEFDKIELKIGVADPVSIFDPETSKLNKFIDWQFDSEGEKSIDFIFTHGDDERTVTKLINAITADQDILLSNDEMLNKLEPDIYDLLPAGRSSFLYVHRMAREKILRELIEAEHEVTIEMFLEIEESSYWSRYMALAFIFESNITSGSDIHVKKRDKYLGLMASAKSDSIISIDDDEDGVADETVKNTPLRLKLV